MSDMQTDIFIQNMIGDVRSLNSPRQLFINLSTDSKKVSLAFIRKSVLFVN